jgi:protein SCO1/2
MYSLSVQPEVDTPAALAEYVRHQGVGPGWQFLTGRPKDVDLIRRRLGFVDADPVKDRDRTEHVSLVRIGNEAIDQWAVCSALAPVEQIVASIMWMDVTRDAVAP